MCIAVPPAQQTWAASSAPSLLNLLPFGAAQAPPAFRPLQARGRHHSTCLSTHTTSSPIPSLIFCSRSIWGSGRWGEVRVVYMCQSSASNQSERRCRSPSRQHTEQVLPLLCPVPLRHTLSTLWPDFQRPNMWLFALVLKVCSACTGQTGNVKRLIPPGNSLPSITSRSWWINNTPAPLVLGWVTLRCTLYTISQHGPHGNVLDDTVFPSPAHLPIPLPVFAEITSQINHLHQNLCLGITSSTDYDWKSKLSQKFPAELSLCPTGQAHVTWPPAARSLRETQVF